ncbi:MAG: FAD-dependent oxidoreductase, partial [Desulfobacterota bacterium]|nr:FAD-dependent oxidoreductase [Thermodesulfobacteriota bacterium]
MNFYPKEYEVIVIGGGHAGCEAALAASRMECSTLLITMNLDTIGLMSCNPAIGGLAKGQIVKEIDALGGEMGKAADRTGIQFRRLNTKKGPAVRSSRAQVDRQAYRSYMKKVLENQTNLDLKQATIDHLLISDRKIYGVETHTGEAFLGKTVIITPGTFLNGLIHIGLIRFPAGRMGDFPSVGL